MTESSKLLLRIYGPQVEHLIDRDKELQILRRLARKRIGPRLLGTFSNGRFEQFFEARTLTAKDLRIPETSKQIARRMRELHEGIELLEEERNAGPFMWQNWDKWVARCEEVISWIDEKMIAGKQGAAGTGADAMKMHGLVCGVEWSIFRKAVDRYRKWLESQYGGPEGIKEELVFAHNDVSRVYTVLKVRFDFSRRNTAIYSASSLAESPPCCIQRMSTSNWLSSTSNMHRPMSPARNLQITLYAPLSPGSQP